MNRRILALVAAAVLAAASAHALTVRTLTGIVIGPNGTAIAAGSVMATPIGHTASSVPGGVVIPISVTYPVAAGNFTCSGGCKIVSPGNYRWQVYETVAGQPVLRWTFNAGIAELSGTITFQEIYAATGAAVVGPSYLLAGSDAAQLGSDAALSGKVLTSNGTGGTGWVTNSIGITDHALLSSLNYASSGHTGFMASGAGMTTVVTIRDSGGSADCTMTFADGILTATTCSHT